MSTTMSGLNVSNKVEVHVVPELGQSTKSRRSAPCNCDFKGMDNSHQNRVMAPGIALLF